MMDRIEFGMALQEQNIFVGEHLSKVYEEIDILAFSYCVKHLKAALAVPIAEFRDENQIDLLRAKLLEITDHVRKLIGQGDEVAAEYNKKVQAVKREYDKTIYKAGLVYLESLTQFSEKIDTLKSVDGRAYEHVSILKSHLEAGLENG